MYGSECYQWTARWTRGVGFDIGIGQGQCCVGETRVVAVVVVYNTTTEEYIDAMQTHGQLMMGACSRGLGLDP